MSDLFGYSAFLHTLPPLVQPIVQVFVPSLLPWTAIAILEQRWIAVHGKSPAAKKISGWLTVPVGAALFYLRDRFPIIPFIMEWPQRHIPGWHSHWWQFLLGFFAAAFVAKGLGILYAAVFLRRSRRSGSRGGGGGGVISVGTHDLLPLPPDGYGWFSPTTPKITRVTRERTIHSDWEDE